jgi:hypothetical protein
VGDEGAALEAPIYIHTGGAARVDGGTVFRQGYSESHY